LRACTFGNQFDGIDNRALVLDQVIQAPSRCGWHLADAGILMPRQVPPSKTSE
jgi:hypothetical protein